MTKQHKNETLEIFKERRRKCNARRRVKDREFKSQK